MLGSQIGNNAGWTVRFFLTFRLWDALVNVDRRAPLYATMWRSHRRYVMWESNELSGLTILALVVNIALAPLFIVLPLLILFPFGAHWAGEVAASLEREHRQNRLDLLAMLPNGRLHAYYTLSVLNIRRTGIYSRIADGLSMTLLIGGMLGFLLSVGLLIAIADAESLRADAVTQLANVLFTTVVFLGGLYVQQIQAVLLSQCIGLALPVMLDFSVGTRVNAIVGYLSLQVALYVTAGVLWLGVFPAVLRLPALNMAVSTVLVGGLLVATHELLLRALWERLQTQLSTAPEVSSL